MQIKNDEYKRSRPWDHLGTGFSDLLEQADYGREEWTNFRSHKAKLHSFLENAVYGYRLLVPDRNV